MGFTSYALVVLYKKTETIAPKFRVTQTLSITITRLPQENQKIRSTKITSVVIKDGSSKSCQHCKSAYPSPTAYLTYITDPIVSNMRGLTEFLGKFLGDTTDPEAGKIYNTLMYLSPDWVKVQVITRSARANYLLPQVILSHAYASVIQNQQP